MRYTYWQENDGMWLGYLNEYPDYMTQGVDLPDLQYHLRDLAHDFNAGLVPEVRHEGMLEFA